MKLSCDQKFLLARKLTKGKRRKKRKGYCAITFELHSIDKTLLDCIQTIWLVDLYLFTRSKMHGQTPLPARRWLRKRQAQVGFHSLSSPRSISFHFFLFLRLLFLLKRSRITASLLINAILKTAILCLEVVFIWIHNST